MRIPKGTSRPNACWAAAAVLASVFWAFGASAAAAFLDGMDRSVAPGEDFFGYANGGWLKSAEIPPDRATYGVDAMLAELTDRRTDALIRKAAASHAPKGSEARKIGDYYQSFMDAAAIEQRGLAPIRPELARIAKISSRRALAQELGRSLRTDVDILNNTNLHTDRPFGLWVAKDLDDPKRNSPFLVQGGLGLPDRSYYFEDSPRMQALRTQYKAHIAAVLTLAGVAEPKVKAARIYDLEAAIAATHVSRTDSEQVKAGDNHWSRADFRKFAPGLDWEAFFAAAGLGRQERFVAWQPGAVKGLSALAAAQPLVTWKDYLTFRALDRASPVLPKAFVEERFDFYGRTLTGQQALSDRWKRAVALTNAALGEAVGKAYVQAYFPPSAKARMQVMVQNLLAAFRKRIDDLARMSPETKAKAQAKLATLRVGVGYPDRWRSYAGLRVIKGDAYGNWVRAGLFDYRENLKRLKQPVDSGLWVMTPQTVNAVNLPVVNALNFPAAYLQPPLFDPNRSDAANYGATGAIIGHEISHSFDDEGALFDASGRLANWWTKEDFAHFKASAAQLARQYDGYRPFPDLAVNGRQTLSENIADVAGLVAAFDAYRLAQHGKTEPVVGGYGGDQQFFIAYAQSYRRKYREAALRQQVLTDGHAPDEYRADTVRNVDAWYAAFSPAPGQALYLPPAERVKMW